MKSFLKNALGLEAQSTKDPLAVIIMGNPKYVDDPRVRDLAEAFYQEIKRILEKRGYRVELDPGEPYTSPDESAALWVGHSRGIDRLRFAGAKIKTMALETKDRGKKYKNNDERGLDPDHYLLSDNDRKLLAII